MKMNPIAIFGVAVFALTLLILTRRPKKKVPTKDASVPPKLILPMNILNKVDWFLQDFFKTRLIKPNTDELIKLAQLPKSDLFGPQDEIFIGINKFMKGFSASNATAFGVFANNRYRRINLEKRRQVIEYFLKHPEIAEIPIRKPIIITGMMRTGSTLLYNLLSQDPKTRSPRLWEMVGTNPNPTPPPRAPFDKIINPDPRALAVEEAILTYKKFVPSILSESAKSHFTGPYEIEEELFILIHQFLHQVILPLSGPEYLEWFLKDENKEYVYIYLKRYLQMLSSGYQPKSHWVLKAPIHSVYMSRLSEQFEDACIVLTHRDPLEAVPSTCKLFELGCYFHYGENSLDRKWVGETACRMSETMCNRMVEFKEKNTSANVVDVRYTDIVKDPIGVVKRIYEAVGHEYTQEFEDNMKQYLVENPQGKHGRNSYDLKHYGLDKEDIEKRFKKYNETYLY